MKRFKNILVVHDDRAGSESALAHGIALARNNSAKLTLLETIKRGTAPLISEYREKHADLLAEAQAIGVDTRSRIAVGKPFIEITRTVLRDKHDLVIASTDAGRAVPSACFGSTMLHLLRQCPCPVWAIPPRHGHAFQNVIAAVALNIDDDAPTLDRKILDLSVSLVSSLPTAHLHIVHGWSAQGRDDDTLRSNLPDIRRELLHERYRQAAEIRLYQLMAAYDIAPARYTVHIAHSSPEALIAQTAKLASADLVVMGMAMRGGASGLQIGSSAESVFDVTRTGVLAVKPEGLASSIQQEAPYLAREVA
ncbi:MAG: hypothetical protein RLZ98_2209 [Pseudomonadota bacterium]|jgi:nucleotide-binding universal stress UspA family protein